MEWGMVVETKNGYAVKGMYCGKRLYFSQIPKGDGEFIPCKTKELAEILQDDISREIARKTFNPGRYRKAKPLHFKQYAKDWLEIRKPNISYRSYLTYKGYIKNHLGPFFNKMYLPDINHKLIQQFFNGLSLHVYTKAQVQTCLRAILNDAKRSGYIHELPPRVKIDIPKKALSWISREDQEKILSEIPARHRPIFKFIMLTGVRPSEARALQKKDIKEDHIILRHAFSVQRRGEVLAPIKTRREDAIPLYEAVKGVLDRATKALSEFVFVDPDTGDHYSRRINELIWNPACIRAIGRVFPLNHAGRHSFANQLIAAGIDIETVASLLRNNPEILKTHYARNNLAVMKGLVDGVQIRGVNDTS